VRKLDSGYESTVSLEPSGRYVTKTYSHTQACCNRGFILQEFEYLQRLSRALSHCRHIRCPQPIEYDLERCSLRMEYCRGVRLDRYIAQLSARHDRELIVFIANSLISVMSMYINEFDEPYYDFGLHNIIFDPDAIILHVYDLTETKLIDCTNSHEVTLGNFLSTSIYHSIRPVNILDITYWHIVNTISKIMCHHYIDRELCLPKGLVTVAQSVYDVWSRLGSRRHRTWCQYGAHKLFYHRLKNIIGSSD
jgi:hypothetical protein